MVSLFIVLLILLPPLVAIWLTQDNLVNAPHYDDFTFLDDWLKFKKGELTWAELFNVHLEHRITVPRMIAIGLHIIGGPDLRWQNALTLLLMLGMLWNITVIWCRGTGRTLRDSWLPLFLMSATLFCTTQWQTLLWPILFEIMIPIWALTQMVSIWTSRMNAWTALALSVLLGAASMLCFASGLLLWVLLPLCIAFIRPELPGSLRRNLLLTWLGLFIVALGLYFGTNYHNAAPEAFAFHFTEQMTAKDTMTNSLKAVAEDPLKAVLFVCATLGTHLCRGMNLNNVQVAEGLGALSIIALTFVIAWIILRGRNRETLSKVSPWVIIGLYSAANGVLLMLGRIAVGKWISTALTPRYVSHAIPLTIALIALACIIGGRMMKKCPRLPVAGFIAGGAFAFLLLTQWIYGALRMDLWKNARLQGRALMLFAGKGVMPTHEFLGSLSGDGNYGATIIQELDALGQFQFPLLKSRSMNEFHMSKEPLPERLASFDELRLTTDGGLYAEGFAEIRAGRPADLIIFTTPDAEGAEHIFGLTHLDRLPLYLRYGTIKDGDWCSMDEVTPDLTSRWQPFISIATIPPHGARITAWALDVTFSKPRAYRIPDNRVSPDPLPPNPKKKRPGEDN